jgi:hypothetical protein
LQGATAFRSGLQSGLSGYITGVYFHRSEQDLMYARMEARGMRNGAVVLTTKNETTGRSHAVRLSADRTEIDDDREDIAIVKVEVIDSDGRLVATASDLISFRVTGEGTPPWRRQRRPELPAVGRRDATQRLQRPCAGDRSVQSEGWDHFH